MSGDVEVMEISEVRTMGVTNDPNMVVLRITAGDDVRHYALTVEGLAGLAKQMAADAALLGAGSGGHA